jgi:type I restriction-modification system DNA methylase subunit
MTAPDKIKQLVETFEQNLNEYRTRKNETELRRQFLDPFFESLGWDVGNNKGLDERRKEVAHELSVEIDGQQKKADYAFRTGTDKFDFLVEAKKPSVKIESNPDPAFQVKRYGWSAKLPINILTDFEHFAVYDCRAKPGYKDKATAGRMHLFHYKDYVEKWDEIAALFSPDAVRAGALDKFTEGLKTKKGTADVDDDFLAEIERWRDLLARNIANRNKDKGLNESQLNYAVQMTIDRIVFLRIAEERGMEEYGRLQALTTLTLPSPSGRGENVYSELKQYFLKADERYNSGLFHFKAEKERAHPDTVTFNLQIDDKVLKDILENLYEPKSPYAFAYIPTDILGSVYERFLGKVIRLTASGQAKVEDKPEVRKAGGVYYTPVYIVEYIVKNTVGKLLTPLPLGEGRVREITPKEASDLKIVDPACGSGSFLLGAYQYLLNWHLDWYVQNDPEKHLKNKVLLTQDNKTYRLSMNEKKRILLNNIHGVDVDPQAVEVTKLSLLLKVVEDPGQLKMFEEGHILPDLGNNIQCGNSLIGMDYFEGQLMTDLAEVARINPFGWENAFPAVFKRGGFDAVIGNPPYIRIQAMQEWASEQVAFYKKAYKAAGKGNYDIYVVFVEKGLSLLNAKGRLGFILPHKFFNAQYGEAARGLIAKGKNLANIVHFSDQQVFDGATTYTCLLFLDKAGHDEFEFVKVRDLKEWRASQTSEVSGMIKAASVTSAEWNFTVGKSAGLFEKLSQMPKKLGDIAYIFVGLQTSADTVFLFKDTQQNNLSKIKVRSKELDQVIEIETGLLKPVVRSGEIGRYWANPSALVLFPYETKNLKSKLKTENDIKRDFPDTWNYLVSNKKLLSEREHGKFKDIGWYQLYPKNLDTWEQPKIMLPYMITRLSAFYDENNYYFVNVTTGGFGVTTDEQFGSQKYITGLLNSKLLDWFMRQVSTSFHGGYFAANKQFLVQLPIRTINFSDPAEKAKHDQMVTLVERMLALHKNLASAKTPQEKESVQRQIQSTDGGIDKLVYELYGLSEEEIGIVES